MDDSMVEVGGLVLPSRFSVDTSKDDMVSEHDAVEYDSVLIEYTQRRASLSTSESDFITPPRVSVNRSPTSPKIRTGSRYFPSWFEDSDEDIVCEDLSYWKNDPFDLNSDEELETREHRDLQLAIIESQKSFAQCFNSQECLTSNAIIVEVEEQQAGPSHDKGKNVPESERNPAYHAFRLKHDQQHKQSEGSTKPRLLRNDSQAPVDRKFRPGSTKIFSSEPPSGTAFEKHWHPTAEVDSGGGSDSEPSSPPSTPTSSSPSSSSSDTSTNSELDRPPSSQNSSAHSQLELLSAFI
ncbi:hypothetical protein L218DRAFT_995431 [Marasmius fiardii PR-910]|nr:hypothetical protein L218DRAFT_995431 [Marasmius fiardii PR-910]